MKEEGAFVLMWPVGLTISDMNRLVLARRTYTLLDEVGRLAVKNVRITEKEAEALTDHIAALSEERGFYVLDPDPDPEPWVSFQNPPACVLASGDQQYIDHNDLPRVMALYNGDNLSPDLPEHEKRSLVGRQRRRPVLATTCKEEECTARVVVTVGDVGRAVINNNLMESDLGYTPWTMCKKHKEENDRKRAERRQNSGKGNGKHKPTSRSVVNSQAAAFGVTPSED